jgi:hypothetical protein
VTARMTAATTIDSDFFICDSSWGFNWRTFYQTELFLSIKYLTDRTMFVWKRVGIKCSDSRFMLFYGASPLLRAINLIL